MNIAIDPLFLNWIDVTSGSGSVSASNGKLTAAANQGDQGYQYTSFTPQPGETYIFSCEARVLTNNGVDPNCGMFIDYYVIPNNQNFLFFDDSGEWRRYELTFHVPADSDISTDKVYFAAGSAEISDGSCEVRLPRVRSSHTSPTSKNIWGKLVCSINTSGTLTVIERYNVSAASWVSGASVADSYLRVTVPSFSSTSKLQPRPVAYMSSSSPAAYSAKAPHVVTSGNVDVKVYSGGAAIQANPSGTTYITVEVTY